MRQPAVATFPVVAKPHFRIGVIHQPSCPLADGRMPIEMRVALNRAVVPPRALVSAIYNSGQFGRASIGALPQAPHVRRDRNDSTAIAPGRKSTFTAECRPQSHDASTDRAPLCRMLASVIPEALWRLFRSVPRGGSRFTARRPFARRAPRSSTIDPAAAAGAPSPRWPAPSATFRFRPALRGDGRRVAGKRPATSSMIDENQGASEGDL